MACGNHTTFDANMRSPLSILQNNCAYSEDMAFGNHTTFDANMQISLSIFQDNSAYSECMTFANHTMFDANIKFNHAYSKIAVHIPNALPLVTTQCLMQLC